MLDGTPIFFILVAILLALFVTALVGTIHELWLMRADYRKKDENRLPFAYRMAGWRIGAPSPHDSGVFQTGVLYDKKRKRWIPIMRDCCVE